MCNAEPTSFVPNVASKLIYRNAPAEEKKVAVACKEVCGQGGIQIPGKVLYSKSPGRGDRVKKAFSVVQVGNKVSIKQKAARTYRLSHRFLHRCLNGKTDINSRPEPAPVFTPPPTHIHHQLSLVYTNSFIQPCPSSTYTLHKSHQNTPTLISTHPPLLPRIQSSLGFTHSLSSTNYCLSSIPPLSPHTLIHPWSSSLPLGVSSTTSPLPLILHTPHPPTYPISPSPLPSEPLLHTISITHSQPLVHTSLHHSLIPSPPIPRLVLPTTPPHIPVFIHPFPLSTHSAHLPIPPPYPHISCAHSYNHHLRFILHLFALFLLYPSTFTPQLPPNRDN